MMRTGIPRHAARAVCAALLAVAAITGLAGCGGPDFSGLSDALQFGDDTVSDTQTVDVMKIPDGGLGSLIGDDQITWVSEHKASSTIANPGGPVMQSGLSWNAATALMKTTPNIQCEALQNTSQEESPDMGSWAWNPDKRQCEKSRELSWLERTLWHMYETQSDETISWLSTSRNTLVAADGTVQTLQANAKPMYSKWFRQINPYLRVAQGVLAVLAAISLCVAGARWLWAIRNDMQDQLIGKIGWIFLGLFLASSCASIALAFFATSATSSDGTTTPALQSWTPGSGTGFYLSDWVRMQVDPFLIIAAACGVVAAGFALITNQEGRGLIPLGKAFGWAVITSVCLAGAVNLFNGTVDEWSANVLRKASSMMNDAWNSNTLAAGQFFELDAPIALLLTVITWLCGMVSKIFCYLRAGLLPVLVGVAPTFAALMWMETGRQAFSRIIGWLIAFLLYKPVAALVMAAGSAIMVTAGAGDDSQYITLALTIGVIVLLPAMIKVVAPAVASSVSGGGIGPMMLGSLAAGGVAVAGAGIKAGAKAVHGIGRHGGKGSSSNTPDGAAGPTTRHGLFGGLFGSPAPADGADGDEGRRGSPDGVSTERNGNAPDGTDARKPSTAPSSPAPDGTAGTRPPAGTAGTPGSETSMTPDASAGPPDGANRKAARRGGKEF